ncbi:MAG: efflux RND transporter permease subunit [Fibrobacterota bacterium]
MSEFLIRNISGRKKWIILVFLLPVVLWIAALPHIEMSDSHRAFFTPDSPDLQEIRALEKAYGSHDNVFFAVYRSEGSVITPKGISLLREIRDSLTTLQNCSSTSSVLSYRVLRSSFAGYTHTALLPDTIPDRAACDSISAVLRADSLLVHRLISPTGNATGINARFDPDSSVGVTDIYSNALRLKEHFTAAYPEYSFHVTGGVAIDASFFRAGVKDAKMRIPILFAIITVLLFAVTASFRATAAILTVLIFPALTALSCAALAGIVLTPPSAIAPIIIMTAGLADAIHIFIHYSHYVRKGLTPKKAMAETLRINLAPVTVTSITTVVGFALLNFSSAPPFRDLGSITALGIALAWLYSIVFFPALICAFFPLRTSRYTGVHDIAGTRLGRVVSRAPRRFTAALVFLTVGLSLCTMTLQFNDTFFRFFSRDYPFRRDTEVILENLTGLDYLEISCAVDSPFIAANLHRFDSLEQQLKQNDAVRHVLGPGQVIRSAWKQLSPDKAEDAPLPGAGMTEKILRSYQQQQSRRSDVPRIFARDTSALRISLTLGEVSSRDLRHLEEQARSAVGQLFDLKKCRINSTSLMFAHLSRDNVQAMVLASGISLLCISGVLIFVSGSFSRGILSLIPNLLPLSAAFGLWACLFTNAGIGVSIVTSMAMGIIVDDTVHILFAWMRARRKGLKGPDALIHTFRHVADAVIITSIILTAGFAVLAASGFQPTAEMGRMTAIIIILALVVDLLLFAPLLQISEGQAPETHREQQRRKDRHRTPKS